MNLLWFVSAPHVLQSVASCNQAGHSVELIVTRWLVAPDSNLQSAVRVHWIDSLSELFNLLDNLLTTSKFDYIVASWPDALIAPLTEIFQNHQVPFLSDIAAKILGCKLNYTTLWRSMRIPTPLVYRKPQQVEVPCIIKPRLGQAGYGVCAITDIKEAQARLNDTSHLVQEFIAGQVVSFMGSVHNNLVEIDMCYDIESDAWPYFAETGLTYPSQHNFLIPDVIKYLQEFCSAIKLDNVPFTLDIIVDQNKDFYFLDFAPRLSINGQLLMHHSGERNYVAKLIQRLHGQSVTMTPTKAVVFRQLGLQPGNVKDINCGAEHLADKLVLPTQVTQVDNDDAVQHNGYAITTGVDIEQAQQKWSDCVRSIQVSYS